MNKADSITAIVKFLFSFLGDVGVKSPGAFSFATNTIVFLCSNIEDYLLYILSFSIGATGLILVFFLTRFVDAFHAQYFDKYSTAFVA